MSPSSPLHYTQFEGKASDPAEGIVFLTRLWRPAQDSDRRHALNERRVALIRALRARFGDQFIGGVEHDEFARRYCPDCIVDTVTLKTTYVQLMKSRLIGIATTGLHGSIGWKLAEYVAATRCIVSEPI